MNRVRLFLENRVVGRLGEKSAQLSPNRGISRGKLIRLSAMTTLIVAGFFFLSPDTAKAVARSSNGTGGGNWNATATWAGGVVPGAGDSVTIVTADTVTVNAATASLIGLTVDGTLTVAQTVNVNSGTANLVVNGTLTYNNGTNRTIIVTGNLTVASGATFNTANATGANSHLLNLAGNLANAGTFNCINGDDVINVTFNGSANQTVSGTAATTSFNLITLNNTGAAGNDILDIASSNFSALSAFLTLTNGVLKMSGTYTFSGNVFTTPAAYQITAGNGIWLNNANVTVSGQNGSPRLNGGSIRITTGTYNVGNSSGNTLTYDSGSSFTMEGGAANIAGRFAPDGNNDTVNFNMSGGTMTVNTIGNASNNAASFNIDDSGSSFTMSGGTIVLQRENTNGNPLDYRNIAGTVSITGGTVQFGNASTPAAASFEVASDPTEVFPSLSIDSTVANSVRLAGPIVVRGNVSINTGTTLNANGQAISVTGNASPGTSPGNWTNSGTFTSGTQTTTFNGSAGQSITGATTFSGLTLNNGAGLTLSSNITVDAVLTLTSGDITTGANTLSQSIGSTSAGTTDVVGNVSRAHAFTALTSYAFGNPNVTVNFTVAGTKPNPLVINLVKSVPGNFGNAVKRTYDITATGGTGFSATLQLHYLTSELNGNTEANLTLWKETGTSWASQGKTGQNTTAPNNWAAFSPVTGFSRWTLADAGSAPTDVAMVKMKATRVDNRVLLEWQTGNEVRNLGFNIYREQKGNYTRINPEPVAGSALLFGPRVALRAGFAYAWWDKGIADCGLGNGECEGTRYWIEDMDLSGHTSFHGPFGVDRSTSDEAAAAIGKEAAPLLGAIGSDAAKLGASAPVERVAKILKPTAAALTAQASIASQQAVKLSVKHEGWYRVEQADLLAAGFPAGADALKLQLFVDGQEVPIRVTTAGTSPGKGSKPISAPWDGIEFYGIGIDSAFTDSHVYWLVAGTQNGLRVNTVPSPGGSPAPATFPFAVERRDKVVYFPSLQNGGAEKFFGPVIYNAQAVDQSLTLQHVATTGTATLDVTLQGYTDAPHSVSVLLNGSELGTVQFTGLGKGTAQYSVPQTSLLEGSNQVQFISPAGFGDITMVESVRMTYQHTNTADGNSLRFPATGSQQATIAGFTSAAVRVLDVTNPGSPQEIETTVEQDGAEYTATVTVPGAGARTLLAFAADQKKTPAALVANQPSSWRTAKNGADYIAVTRKDLIASIQPLANQRKSQGLKTSVVDIEDVYDEFSFGHKTPQALKDFFVYTKTSWKIGPRFALLGGDATYDPKNYTGVGDFDVIPTRLFESAFSETATDDWFVDVDGDFVPDIAIGRLPVRTPQETATLAAKIVRYDRSAAVPRVLLAADHNDGYDFEAADTQLQSMIPATLTVVDIRRGQVGDAAARTQLLEALNVGAKFVNYYGHGSTLVWTNASILTAADAASLGNTDRLALFDSMTCFTGFFHDVSIASLGEALLKAPGGAIAVWASSGMTDAGGQVQMNEEAMRLLFGGGGLTIGEVTARAKAATINADVRRTWILLGDPATKLK